MKAILLTGVLGLVIGCGPVESTAVILQANTALLQAKAAGAEQNSPYEYTAAEQYLHKARELWGTSNFEYAWDYAAKARDLATKAHQDSWTKDRDEAAD